MQEDVTPKRVVEIVEMLRRGEKLPVRKFGGRYWFLSWVCPLVLVNDVIAMLFICISARHAKSKAH